MSASEEMSGTHDCGDDAAAYVLGALEPAEAEAFRTHLESCAICREEIDALAGVVQALPMAAPQHPMRKGLRRRVIRAIREEPRVTTAPATYERPRHRMLRPALATGGVAVILAGAALAGVELSPPATQGRVIHAEVRGNSGSAELRISNGKGELIVRHLAALPRGGVYEVWLQFGQATPTPASVLFGVNSRGDAEVGLPETLRGVHQVMVTREPRGGSPVPTSSPVIVARLT
jgi:anti-sigma-K factor RskA